MAHVICIELFKLVEFMGTVYGLTTLTWDFLMLCNISLIFVINFLLIFYVTFQKITSYMRKLNGGHAR